VATHGVFRRGVQWTVSVAQTVNGVSHVYRQATAVADERHRAFQDACCARLCADGHHKGDRQKRKQRDAHFYLKPHLLYLGVPGNLTQYSVKRLRLSTREPKKKGPVHTSSVCTGPLSFSCDLCPQKKVSSTHMCTNIIHHVSWFPSRHNTPQPGIIPDNREQIGPSVGLDHYFSPEPRSVETRLFLPHRCDTIRSLGPSCATNDASTLVPFYLDAIVAQCYDALDAGLLDLQRDRAIVPSLLWAY